MTREEYADLKIAIGLIQGVEAKVDKIPAQTRELIADAMRVHLLERHARDAEVVEDVGALMEDRRQRRSLGRFLADHWRPISIILIALTAVLEIAERLGWLG